MADEEITVTLDGAAELPRSQESAQAQTEPSQDLTEQFKALEAEKETQRLRAERAEQEAARRGQEVGRLSQEAQAARSRAADSDLNQIMVGIDAAKIELAAAEAEWSTAFDNGDKAAMVAANRKQSIASAKLLRLDESKYEAEAQAQRPQRVERTGRQEPIQRQEQPREPADPVEAFISQRSNKTAAWLRAHPDHARAIVFSTAGRATAEQQRLANKINAAHSNALAEGYALDSQEYFDHVESFIDAKKAPATTANAAANGANGSPVNGKRRQSVPAAPVHQSGGGTGGNSGTEVRLSSKEAAAATDGTLVWNYDDPSGQKRFKKGDVIGVQEFARRKHEMQKQGLYDKSYTEQ